MLMFSLAWAVNENDAAVNAAKPKSDLILFIILFSVKWFLPDLLG